VFTILQPIVLVRGRNASQTTVETVARSNSTRTQRSLRGCGIGGIAIGAGGLTFLAGAAALALSGVGTVIVSLAVGYALVKGIPRALKRPEELVDHIVGIDELSDVSPAIPKLSIIRPSQTGKTTLKHRLSFDFSPLVRTQQITAKVVSLQTTPPRYIAILDGGGERYPQQFKLAEVCDCLCVVLDHNISDTDLAVSAARLSEHKAFLKQIRHHLDERAKSFGPNS
jgi:hypothetical protein